MEIPHSHAQDDLISLPSCIAWSDSPLLSRYAPQLRHGGHGQGSSLPCSSPQYAFRFPLQQPVRYFYLPYRYEQHHDELRLGDTRT